jgi:hypothetical protein
MLVEQAGFRCTLEVLLVRASVMRSRGTSVTGDHQVTLTQQSSHSTSRVVAIEHGTGRGGEISKTVGVCSWRKVT